MTSTASAASALSDHAIRILETVHVSAELRGRLATMLETSATFRSQCERIAREPGVYVRVKIDPRVDEGPFRARSTITRTPSGAIVAFVEIGARGDPTEWLAHELEHVIEQIEGLRVRELAEAGEGAAWRSGEDMFETERAVRTGRIVLGEIRDARRLAARVATPPAWPALSASSLDPSALRPSSGSTVSDVERSTLLGTTLRLSQGRMGPR